MKWLPREIAAPAYFAATNSSPKYCIGQKWPKGRPISTKLPLEEIQPEYDKHFQFQCQSPYTKIGMQHLPLLDALNINAGRRARKLQEEQNLRRCNILQHMLALL